MPSRAAVWAGVGWVAFGLVLVLEVLSMGKAGLSKFQDAAGWQYWFEQFGYPRPLAFVIGVVEMFGAALLLVPRLASYAALGLAVVMVGALQAVLTTDTDLGWFDPVLHLVMLGVIGGVRWPRRWRPPETSR